MLKNREQIKKNTQRNNWPSFFNFIIVTIILIDFYVCNKGYNKKGILTEKLKYPLFLFV